MRRIAKVAKEFSFARMMLCCLLYAASMAFPSSASAAIRFDSAQVEDWANSYFAEKLEAHQMTGAAISVFQDGRIIFAKGYGYEDLSRKRPFNPQLTKVRVCSNSKVIVATALMQFVDRGIIKNLSDPANHYLKRIKLPKKDGKDITIFDLLTHRTGFSAAYFGPGTDKAVSAPVRPELYKKLLPDMILPPGELSSYANAALAIQGAIIEDLTGQELGEYLKGHVFKPSGMANTLYHHRPGEPEGLATPYRLYPDGSVTPVPFIAKHPVYAPSGGVISTATDMAGFLIKHVDEGRSADNEILKPETYRAMHRRQVGNHPAMSGLGLQFFTDTHNGEPVASHGCGLPGFTTKFGIFPESNSGFFISVVSAEKELSLTESLLSALAPARMAPKDGCCLKEPINAFDPYDAFIETFLGERVEDKSQVLLQDEQRHDLNDYVGEYVRYRSVQGNILSMINFAFTTPVSHHEEGGLQIGEDGPFFEIATDLFQHKRDGSLRFAFIRNDSGKVASLVWNSSGSAYKTRLYSDPVSFQKFFSVLLIVSITGLVALCWPAATKSERLATMLPSCIVLGFVTALACFFAGFDADSDIASIKAYLNVGRSGRLWALAFAGNLIALCIGAMIWFAWRSHLDNYWGWGVKGVIRRVHFSIIAFAGLLTAPYFFTFHILGFQLP